MQIVKAQCENCNGMLEFNAKYGLLICPFCGASYMLEKDNHKKKEKPVQNQSIYSVKTKYGWCDDLFPEAGLYIIRTNKASIGYLQRMLKIGFTRAARIMDELAENGVVGMEQGTKPRHILMTESGFIAYCREKGIDL